MPMDLEEYLFKYRKSFNVTEFARKMNVTDATIQNIKKCRASPSIYLALKIHRYSKGQVELETMLCNTQREKLEKELKELEKHENRSS